NCRVGVLERNGSEFFSRITEMQHDVRKSNQICQLQGALDFVECRFPMATFWLQDRYPGACSGADILYKRQMQRRRRKGVLLKPSADRAQEAAVVEVHMRSITKDFDVLVSGTTNGLQEFHSDRSAA